MHLHTPITAYSGTKLTFRRRLTKFITASTSRKIENWEKQMPTYEYECETCQKRFEVFQKMADDPVKNCPSCGNAVRRILSGGLGILFQGSGFYANDSKKKAESPKAAAPKPSDATQAPKDTKDSGTKSASENKSTAPQT
jgi:putative FmdB family regulatory protein